MEKTNSLCPCLLFLSSYCSFDISLPFHLLFFLSLSFIKTNIFFFFREVRVSARNSCLDSKSKWMWEFVPSAKCALHPYIWLCGFPCSSSRVPSVFSSLLSPCLLTCQKGKNCCCGSTDLAG